MQIARELGDPNLAPTANNLVIAATESAKERTAKESAFRMAAVSGKAAGLAASTLEQTKVALDQAESAYVSANAGVIATATALEAPILDRQAELLARRGLTPSTATPAQAAAAYAAASAAERAENLSATANVAAARARSKNEQDKKTTIGENDALEREVDEETEKVQNANPLLSAPAAKAQAEANVLARNTSATGDAARSQAAKKFADERGAVEGVQRGLDTQIAFETNRLLATGLSPAQAAREAEANVRAINITGAANTARGKASIATREENEANIGILQDGQERVKAIMDERGLTQEKALAAAIREGHDAAGATARDAAATKSRAADDGKIGVKQELDAMIADEMDKSGVNQATAEETVQSRRLQAAGSNARQAGGRRTRKHRSSSCDALKSPTR